MEVQYVTNAKGKKTGVLLSMKDWKELLSNPEVFKMMQELQQAFHELRAYEAGDTSVGMSEEEFFASLNEPE
jgi:hypothetical protein